MELWQKKIEIIALFETWKTKKYLHSSTLIMYIYLLKKQTKEICNHISTNSKHSSKGKLLGHVGCSSFFAKQSASKNTGKETRVSVRIGLFLVPCSYLCGFMEGLTHSRNYLIEADMTPWWLPWWTLSKERLWEEVLVLFLLDILL